MEDMWVCLKGQDHYIQELLRLRLVTGVRVCVYLPAGWPTAEVNVCS